LRYLKQVLIVAFVLIFNVACAQKNYLVSIYDIEPSKVDEINNLYQQTTTNLQNTEGRLLAKPLLIKKELHSPSMPVYTKPLQGNVITVLEFPNKKSIKAYLKSDSKRVIDDHFSKHTNNEVSFLAKEFNPFGMLGTEPPLGDIDHKPDPAFILVNALTLKSFVNPATPYRMMQYKKKNFHRVKSVGVEMLMPLKKTKSVKGEYEHEILFLTDTESKAQFLKAP